MSRPPALPRLVVLTDRRAAARCGRTLRATIREAAAGGARAVLLREKDLPVDQRRRLLDELVEALAPVGGRVGVASDGALAVLAGSGWVHLASADPPPSGGPSLLVGRSCHDAAEIARARAEGCDYVFVSPVAASTSKPGYGPPLGPTGLAEASRSAAPMPVWALGGVGVRNARIWCRSGAAGVAVMGEVMAAADPAATTAALIAAVEST